jgi:site-specific recombinase XerD
MPRGQPWLFPGYRGQHMSARQLHRLVRMAAARAGITKRVGVHTLRHSFATLRVPGDVAHYSGMMSPHRYDLMSPSVPR